MRHGETAQSTFSLCYQSDSISSTKLLLLGCKGLLWIHRKLCLIKTALLHQFLFAYCLKHFHCVL